MEYIGDKVMPDQPVIRAIEARLPSPKFIFIYRGLLHVASSYAARARNPDDSNWPAAGDHKVAVERWREAFSTADGLIGRVGGDDVCIVKYKRLFNRDIRVCEVMFRFLGLRASPSVRRTYAARTADWDQRRSKPLQLSPSDMELVLRGLDRDVLNRFDLRFEQQLDRA